MTSPRSAAASPASRGSDFDLLSLPTRAAIRHRNSVSFVTVRSWPARKRRDAIAAFRLEKRRKTPAILQAAAVEISDELGRLLGDFSRWQVTAIACGHSRDEQCWGKTLAQTVAQQLGAPFVQIFADRFVTGSSHPKEFRNLPALVIETAPTRNTIIVDDVATSGFHFEEAALALRPLGVSTIAAAWISGTLTDRDTAKVQRKNPFLTAA